MFGVYHREVEILVVRVPAVVEIGGISVAFWLKKREKNRQANAWTFSPMIVSTWRSAGSNKPIAYTSFVDEDFRIAGVIV